MQQITEAYNGIAQQYRTIYAQAIPLLGTMIAALTDAKFEEARTAGRAAAKVIKIAITLHRTAEQYRSGRGAHWQEYYQRHLLDSDIANAAMSRYTSIEEIAALRANEDDKRPTLPALAPPPNIAQCLMDWIGETPLGTAQRQ